MSDDEHDEWCESEFIVEAGGYTPCDCANRNELRRRGFTVARPPSPTEGADPSDAEFKAKTIAAAKGMRRWLNHGRALAEAMCGSVPPTEPGSPIAAVEAFLALVEGSEGA